MRSDGVLNFAELAYVGESVRRPELYSGTNMTGTQNLLDAIRLADASKIVVSSTCATYGAAAETPIHESTLQMPVNPYGRKKLMMQTMFHDYSKALGFSAVSLRNFNAGADPDPDIGENHEPEKHFDPTLLKRQRG